MNREETLLILKAKLGEDLEKIGSSLLEFEEVLTKEALIDEAVNGVGTAGSLMGKLLEGGLTATLLAGTTLGGVHYAANRHLTNQDKALNEKRLEVDRYKQLTDRVKADYQL